jgi:magnesium chelatase subunit D
VGPAEEPAQADEQVFAVSVLPTPYPEDTASAAREAYSLQLPQSRGRDARGGGGIPVGTRRVRGLHDLAIVSTILEAAKFQRVRPPLQGRGGQIRVTPDDLRGYRRIPLPQQVLAVLLDYTSLADSHWQAALVPHLEWAYVARASVCLVQVGARGAPDPLRATQVTARNLLDPRIRAAFDEGAGTATPLAHGLDLAARMLRRAFHQGRARIRGGVLVVVTDGRGNVPLEASLTGELRGRVLREGVDDALRTARQLGEMKDLIRVVLHPQPQQYPRLPLELAEAMGAAAQAMELAEPAVEGA